jgi:hypothetical protein
MNPHEHREHPVVARARPGGQPLGNLALDHERRVREIGNIPRDRQQPEQNRTATL